MDTLLLVLLPGFAAVASGVLCWFIMQSRMEVRMAELRECMAADRGALDAEKEAVKASLETALKATEETAKRQALDSFLSELNVEQRHYMKENRMLLHNRRTLVLQERMCFRNLPLSDWIEHEIVMEEGDDVNRLVRDMTVFDKEVVSISEIPRRKQLA